MLSNAALRIEERTLQFSQVREATIIHFGKHLDRLRSRNDAA
jgi:hypothetical protein